MRVGPYIVDGCVGRGGMAVVWRVRHAQTDHHFALKALTKADPVGTDVALNAELVATARLDHRNIVGVRDFGRFEPDIDPQHFTPGAPYLVLEWMSGGTLRDHMGSLDWPKTLGVLRAVLNGLTHAHAHHVLNRDLKPENVLCGSKPPDWRIADFGIALHGTAPRRHKVSGGTPPYMAPEQARGLAQEQGPWTDLYALGCMTWEMVTGAPPFVGRAADVIRQQVYTSLPEFRPRFFVPEGLERWLRILLQKQHLLRPHFASDALVALDDLGRAKLTATWTAPMTTSAETWQTLPITERFDDEFPAPSALPSAVGQLPTTPIQTTPHRPQWASGLDDALLRVSRSPDIGLLGKHSVLPVVAGRDRCKARMWHALVTARTTHSAQLMILRGAQGMGRSRMATWLASRAHELGQTYRLWIRCRSDLRHPLHHALTQHFGIADPHRAATPSRLKEWLPELEQQTLERAVHALKSPNDDNVLDLITLLVALSQRRALVLVFDDLLHHPASIAVIDALLSHPEPHPTFILLTVGDRRVAGGAPIHRRVKEWAARQATCEHRLGPMQLGAWRGMVIDQLNLSVVDADRLGQASGHNPGLGRQLLRDLNEQGRLELTPMSVTIRGVIELPTQTIDAMDLQVRRLIQPMSDGARTSLVLAALMGRRVHQTSWRRVQQRLHLEYSTDVGARAVAGGVVWRVDDHWEFVSDPVRHAVIAHSDIAARIHQAIADDLIEQGQPDPVTLAGHLFAAQSWESAAYWLDHAVHHQLDRGDPTGLSRIANQLETALQHLGVAPSDRRRSTVFAARCTVAIGDRDLDQMLVQHVAFTEACEVYGWNRLEVGQLEQAGHALSWHKKMSTLVDDLAQAFTIDAVPNGSVVRTFYRLGRMAPGQGRTELARRAHIRAVEVADEVGRPWLRITARYGRGIHLLESGELDEGEYWLDQAESIANAADPSLSTLSTLMGHVWNARGEANRRRHRYDAAISWYIQAWHSYRQRMDGASRVALTNLCGALVQDGRNLEARLALDRRGADRWLTGALILAQCRQVTLAAACAGQGDWDSMEAHLKTFECKLAEHPHMDPEYPLMLNLAADRAAQANAFQHEKRIRVISQQCERALAGGDDTS